MPSSSEPETPLDKIAAEHLGILASASDDEEVTLSAKSVRAALQAAAAISDGETDREGIDIGKDAAMLFWQLMDSLPDHVWFKNTKSEFLCINRALAKFFHLEAPQTAIGKTDFDVFRDESADLKFEAEEEIMRTGKGWTFVEEHDLRADGSEKWQVTTKLPLYDRSGKICGTFGTARDITERKLIELELDRQRQLLQTIVQILPCRIFVRDLEGKFLLINEEYRKRFGLRSREDVVGHRLTDFRSSENALRIEEQDRKIVETGQPVYNQLEYDKSLLGEKSWVLTSKVPLRSSKGEIEGTVGVTLDITEQKEAEAALKEKNEQFETELLVARHLQEHMMAMGFDDQPFFEKEGANWSIEASYLYKPSHHLAGDFFFLLPVSKDRLGILICDVMGHGVKASLVTMLLRGLMLEDTDLLVQPEKLLEHLNRNLYKLAEDEEFPRFVTAVYCVVNLKNGNVGMANAGHPIPLRRVEDEEGVRFEACPAGDVGPALGLIEDEKFGHSDFKLTSMSELFFFTDGLVEEMTTSGDDYGVERLAKAIMRHDALELPEQLKSIASDIEEASAAQALSDDICMIAVRVKPNE